MPERPWNAIFEARQKLNDYINALWAGRAMGTDSIRDIYTDRLAAAAKLSTLLDGLSRMAMVREILREENQAFPREFLTTDNGRDARAKFNLMSRAALALEDYQSPDGSIATGPESLIGENLSSVTFVNDYVQLDFGRQDFSAYCPIIVYSDRGTFRSWCDGFRDSLCDAIDQWVVSIEIDRTKVDIGLSRCRIELLFGEDQAHPEPLIFTNRDQRVSIYIDSDHGAKQPL